MGGDGQLTRGVRAVAGRLAYGCSRRGVRGFTECLVADLAGTGVGVTEVVAGHVDSPYFDNNPRLPRAHPGSRPPVQPLAIVVTVPLSFLYTWLLNRTGSALLCLLLHASITPAQDHLTLVPDALVVDVVVLATLVLAAVAVVAATRGRLGLPRAGQRAVLASG